MAAIVQKRGGLILAKRGPFRQICPVEHLLNMCTHWRSREFGPKARVYGYLKTDFPPPVGLGRQAAARRSLLPDGPLGLVWFRFGSGCELMFPRSKNEPALNREPRLTASLMEKRFAEASAFAEASTRG